MRRNCKLILVEGLCGTGKSTLAEQLNGYLLEQGAASRFYDEGAKGHPVSLNWHAYFREGEYRGLLERHPSVLEAVFLQHQIHDLIKHYQADDAQIEQHIQGIASSIAALNPILIYLSQPSVREQQTWISTIRSKPHFAAEQSIRFMENRKRIELMMLERLPFPAYLVENEHRDWDEVFRQIISAVEMA